MDWHLVNIDPKYGTGWTGYTWNRELFPKSNTISGQSTYKRDESDSEYILQMECAHEEMYVEMAKLWE